MRGDKLMVGDDRNSVVPGHLVINVSYPMAILNLVICSPVVNDNHQCVICERVLQQLFKQKSKFIHWRQTKVQIPAAKLDKNDPRTCYVRSRLVIGDAKQNSYTSHRV